MREEIQDRNLELISKYLGNELTNEESAEFAKWLEESELNRKELELAENAWKLSSLKEMQLFNTDKGWSKMRDRISTGKDVQQAIRKHIMLNVLKIAASVFIIVSMAFAGYRIVDSLNYIKVTAETEKIIKPIILPDGSQVCLNTGSTIRYPKKFKGHTRRVELTGEAFFHVTRNEQQPFIVQIPHAQVRVLGTSFNVFAYKNGDSAQVVVETGIVELSSKKAGEPIRLTKGNTGVYFNIAKKMVKFETSDINAFAWKTNEIVFHESNMEYVSSTLKKVFAKNITIDNPGLKACRLNANFKDKDLDSILDVIKEIFKVEIKKTSNGYIIKGAGC
jgi:transmembrane sensor